MVLNTNYHSHNVAFVCPRDRCLCVLPNWRKNVIDSVKSDFPGKETVCKKLCRGVPNR